MTLHINPTQTNPWPHSLHSDQLLLYLRLVIPHFPLQHLQRRLRVLGRRVAAVCSCALDKVAEFLSDAEIISIFRDV
jgi:hypothetical protein